MKDWNDLHNAGGSAREAGDRAETWKANGAGNQNSSWREHVFSAASLRSMEFPPVSFIVPGFVPEGLTILAGRPKIGKSWLALEVCLGVAGDYTVLGGSQPVPGDVLYCALEDNPRRLQKRIYKLLAGREWRYRSPPRVLICASMRISNGRHQCSR
jgi:predicted ATP-dependent serine protease